MAKIDKSKAAGAHTWSGELEFRTLAETVPALVFVTDGDGANIYTNVQFQRFVGLAAAQLLGHGWLAAIHPDDRSRAARTWAESCTNLSAYEARYRFRRFDGNTVWHLVRGTPILDYAGGASRWVGSCTDIDELVAGIANRTQSEAILAALGASPDLIVYAKDAQCRFIYVNDATRIAARLSNDRILGRTVADVANRSSEAAAIHANDLAALADGGSMTFDETWTDFTGRTRRYSSTKMPLRLADGSVGLAALSIDVTAMQAPETGQAKADLTTALCAYLDQQSYRLCH